jgi:hypothetical protein
MIFLKMNKRFFLEVVVREENKGSWGEEMAQTMYTHMNKQ